MILYLCLVQWLWGSMVLSQCLPGQQYDPELKTGSSFCQNCSLATYSVSSNATSCLSCPPDTYTPGVGRSYCLTCPIGRGGILCTYCLAGSYKSSRGIQGCTACPPGTYSKLVAATSVNNCTRCSEGTYASLGSTCLSCPEHTTSPLASSRITDCMAQKGYYAYPGQPAQPCPKGYYCPQSTMQPLPCPGGKVSESGASECTMLEDIQGNLGSRWIWVGGSLLALVVGLVTILGARKLLTRGDKLVLHISHIPLTIQREQ